MFWKKRTADKPGEANCKMVEPPLVSFEKTDMAPDMIMQHEDIDNRPHDPSVLEYRISELEEELPPIGIEPQHYEYKILVRDGKNLTMYLGKIDARIKDEKVVIGQASLARYDWTSQMLVQEPRSDDPAFAKRWVYETWDKDIICVIDPSSKSSLFLYRDNLMRKARVERREIKPALLDAVFDDIEKKIIDWYTTAFKI